MSDRGPLTQQTRRARRMGKGPPDTDVARDRLREGVRGGGDRTAAPGRRPQMQEPPDRQNQTHKKRQHACLLQKPASFVPVLFLIRK